MDADDLARGRELLAKATPGPWVADPPRDVDDSWGVGVPNAPDCTDISPYYWLFTNIGEDARVVPGVNPEADTRLVVWLRNHAIFLLDAAERAARLEAALREIVGIGMRPTFDAAAESERITAIARAALEQPKGADGA